MKSFWRMLALLELILLVGVTAFTNPDVDDHTQALVEADPVFMATQQLGTEVLGGEQIEHHSYLVASTTTLDGERLTLGLLGRVWVVGLEPEAEQD